MCVRLPAERHRPNNGIRNHYELPFIWTLQSFIYDGPRMMHCTHEGFLMFFFCILYALASCSILFVGPCHSEEIATIVVVQFHFPCTGWKTSQRLLFARICNAHKLQSSYQMWHDECVWKRKSGKKRDSVKSTGCMPCTMRSSCFVGHAMRRLYSR